MVAEEIFIQYGALGAVTLVLIYDRLVLMPKLVKSINNLAISVATCPLKKSKEN